jgi:inner membrane protein
MIEQAQSIFEKNAITIKVFIIGFLTLVLMIPMEMIRSVMNERKNRQSTAFQEISSKWGSEQLIAGPVLTIPYTRYELNDKQERINLRQEKLFVLPGELNIQAEMIPETRSRGIFRVAVYRSVIHLNGRFKIPEIEQGNSQITIDWDKARVSVGISDMKGISDSVQFDWNDENLVSEPGVHVSDLFSSGFSAQLPLKAMLPGDDNTFAIGINLNGSRNLSFAPLGKETYVDVISGWPDPSFSGAFLPFDRNITSDGFTASWKVLEFNRNYPQQWANQQVNIQDSVFGVSLILPVDNYQVVERSMKYAILFFAFTFMVFFFMEVLKKYRIHPLQYILVGFGLSLFYLMLLSLAEHLGFGLSYFLASVGIISLITGYSRAIFKSNLLSGIMAGFLLLVYGLLFVLLQMQDYALLLGSLVLFVVLAVVMYLTLKIDWYGNRNENNSL